MCRASSKNADKPASNMKSGAPGGQNMGASPATVVPSPTGTPATSSAGAGSKQTSASSASSAQSNHHQQQPASSASSSVAPVKQVSQDKGAKASSAAPPMAEAKNANGNGNGSNGNQPFRRAFSKDSVFMVFEQETPDVWSVYRKLGPLGEPGYYGRAYAAENMATGEKVAIKKINKRHHGYSAKMMEAYRKEIDTMSRLTHPHVIKLVDAFETKEFLYIVMEFASGGELYDHIVALKHYTERDAAGIIKQLLYAVKAMHDINMGHFDLKPSNCVFSSDQPDAELKLIDFGMARFWRAHLREKFTTPAGTVQYSAPELLQREYNLASDMWSVGVMVYVMLIGFPPFYDNPNAHLAAAGNDRNDAERRANQNIKAKIMAGFQPVTKPGYGPWFSSEKASPQLSAVARDFISKLLKSSVAERLTVDEALAHPFLNGEADSAPLAPVVFKALREFNSAQRFQHEVLNIMVELLNDNDMKSLENTFASMDEDGDDRITVDEFKRAMRRPQWYKEKVDMSEVDRIFASVDVNGDGYICYSEMLNSMVEMKLVAKEERLRIAFEKLDINGNGTVTKEELSQVLDVEHVGDAKSLLADVDKNSDGVIDYEEFLAVWRTKDTNKF